MAEKDRSVPICLTEDMIEMLDEMMEKEQITIRSAKYFLNRTFPWLSKEELEEVVRYYDETRGF